MSGRLIRLLSDSQKYIPAQRVYTKSRWYDEWTLVPELWCNFAEWNAAPSMPVAEIEFRYGVGLSEGGAAFADYFRLENLNRKYVKIEFDTHSLPLDQGGETVKWYGIIDVGQDSQHGAIRKAGGTWKLSGKQFFTCYGLESLLQQVEVVRDRVRTYSGTGWTNCGLTYNHEGRGNRTATLQGLSYLFEGKPDASPKHWSTYDIVDYVLKIHRPTDANGTEAMPFYLYDPNNVLPGWDKPQLASHRVSVREILNTLINRNRLLSWKLNATDDGIAVEPFSFTDMPITLDHPDGAETGYNPNTIQIAAERDTGATVVVKSSTLDSFDQIRAEGARKTTTATFSFFDDSLAIGWTSTQETAFEGGGASDPAYPDAADVELRQFFVMNFRIREEMKHVFSRFVLPADWEGTVKDGLGESDPRQAFPVADDPATGVPLALEHRRFTHGLALREGIDYETIETVQYAFTEFENERRRPLILLPRPIEEGTDRSDVVSEWTWIQADTASLTTNAETVGFPFSVRAYVGHDGSLYVDVVNGLQEWLAGNNFTPIDGIDEVMPIDVTYSNMLATLTIEWSEFASATYPATAATSRDVARRLVIDCGDSYRMDYIIDGTAIGLNPDGTLRRADCGDDPGAYFRDDSDELAGIAQMAYQWYSRTRQAVDISTSLITSAISIGDYVTTLGDWDLTGDVLTEDINSVVTAIRFESRSAEGDATSPLVPQVPRMMIQTGFGELDVLKMLAKRRGK